MKRSLNGKWKLNGTNIVKTLDVSVPGSILNDLYVKGLIPDPYYRDNEELILELMKYDYTYTKEFVINDSEVNKMCILFFDGIDTVSEVYLNDEKLIKTCNMHRGYQIDITGKLQKGKNIITVVIKSVLDFIEEEKKKCKHSLMQMSYAVEGYIHVRKAHSMFGWDWGPQLVDGGIWRDVYLDLFDEGKIKSVNIETKLINGEGVIYLDIENIILKDLNLESVLYFDNNIISKVLVKANDVNHITLNAHNPKLWNVYGYGKQNLYRVEITLKNDKVVDTINKKVGFRDLKIVREKDEFGESFYPLVNGIKVFCKGADYIPEDSILPRSNDERTMFLLSSMQECNHNTVRIWGGGLYPSDKFYDLCDEKGLLVWQDLMFACGYYNLENPLFKNEIKEEITYNLKRIKHHPSIMLICGNNENETAIAGDTLINWNVPDIEYTKKWYLIQYESYIKEIVEKVIPNLYYWPSSPSSGGGFDNPNDEKRGDMHYWGVWHNNEPIDNYYLHFPRFLSEFGMQSFPDIETIKSFTIEEDRNVFSYVMEKHQKNKNANSKIINYISSLFKFPSNLESLVYLSQLTQGLAMKTCVEHLRCNYGRCMGAIYWQLNDCWPVASWSSIDYYNRYKALQYFSKKFYAPFIISIDKVNNDTFNLVLVNETSDKKMGKIVIKRQNFFGDDINTKTIEYVVDKYSKKVIDRYTFELSKEEKMSQILRIFVFENDKLITDNFITFDKYKYLKISKPVINVKLEEKSGKYDIELESDTFVPFVKVDVLGEIIHFSDNYFNLYKGEKKKVSFYKDKKITIKDIKIISLYDSY